MLTAKSTMPTKHKPRDIIKSRASEYLSEIQARFGHKSFKPKHLGDGGVGRLSRRHKQGRQGDVGKHPAQESAITNSSSSSSRARRARRNKVYEHFYVHSVSHKPGTEPCDQYAPFCVRINGVYAKRPQSLSRQDRWTSAELRASYARSCTGYLFHRIGYVITDKVDNVLINFRGNSEIKLNDFASRITYTHARHVCTHIETLAPRHAIARRRTSGASPCSSSSFSNRGSCTL